MRLVCIIAALVLPCYAQLTAITGTFVLPDSSNFNGSAVVQLTQPTVTNTCGSPKQVVTFKKVTTQITAGSLGSLNLYASPCLLPGVAGNGLAIPLSGAGLGASASLTGQWYGTLTLVAGTNPSALTGVVKTGLTVPNGVTCYMQPSNTNASGSGVTLSQTTQARQTPTVIGRYLTLTAGSTALGAGLTYTWTFACVEPYTVNVYDSSQRLAYSAQWVVPGLGGGSADVTQIDLTQISQVPQQ
jgi:hypothetical protein